MSGTLVRIAPDGSVSTVRHDGAGWPDLEVLQREVGGYVERLPHGVRYQGRACAAFVDEDGRMKRLPFNATATQLWLDVLGRGPFSYEPRIVGPLLIWVVDAKASRPVREARASASPA